MRTSEVLNKAADLIEKRGWTQVGDVGPGTTAWGQPDGGSPICLEGGIAAALDLRVMDNRGLATPAMEELISCPAYIAVSRYLAGRLAEGAPLYRYNDHPDRTAEQVIATLRAAALIEAAKENESTHRPEFSVDDLHVIAKKYGGTVIEQDGEFLVTVVINGTPTICRAHGVESVRA